MPKENPALDVVITSVNSYRDHIKTYAQHNANAIAATAAEFSEQLPAGSRILDAGCGPGRDLERFTANGHHPVGLDMSPEFLKEARKFAQVILGDLRFLPFEDDAFDALWASASLVHLPRADALKALEEISRVTKPGALVYISVKHEGSSGWVDSAHGRRWFEIWDPTAFVAAAETAGLKQMRVDVNPVFVDLWARA